ncbi:MAG: DUF4124 domain-containing protein [Gammaproteobacteria bacterium]|nr:MAG: DUF4124 domain-containing protein [Gammaproteobacteria bacterium]
MLGISLPGSVDTPALVKVPQSLEPEVVREVFKWRDADGVLHYGDAPPDGVKFETITVSNRINVIKSVPVERPEEKAARESPVAGSSPRDAISEEAKEKLEEAAQQDVLSVERAMDIMNEAKAVRELMEARNQQLSKLVGDE